MPSAVSRSLRVLQAMRHGYMRLSAVICERRGTCSYESVRALVSVHHSAWTTQTLRYTRALCISSSYCKRFHDLMNLIMSARCDWAPTLPSSKKRH